MFDISLNIWKTRQAITPWVISRNRKDSLTLCVCSSRHQIQRSVQSLYVHRGNTWENNFSINFLFILIFHSFHFHHPLYEYGRVGGLPFSLLTGSLHRATYINYQHSHNEIEDWHSFHFNHIKIGNTLQGEVLGKLLRVTKGFGWEDIKYLYETKKMKLKLKDFLYFRCYCSCSFFWQLPCGNDENNWNKLANVAIATSYHHHHPSAARQQSNKRELMEKFSLKKGKRLVRDEMKLNQNCVLCTTYT